MVCGTSVAFVSNAPFLCILSGVYIWMSRESSVLVMIEVVSGVHGTRKLWIKLPGSEVSVWLTA